MYTRLFFAEIQNGKAADAWKVLEEFAHRVKQHKGCILNQVLQNGNEIVGVTTWETKEELAAYAEGPVARDLFQRITPLLMGLPSVRTCEVKLNLCDPAALKPA